MTCLVGTAGGSCLILVICVDMDSSLFGWISIVISTNSLFSLGSLEGLLGGLWVSSYAPMKNGIINPLFKTVINPASLGAEITPIRHAKICVRGGCFLVILLFIWC